MKVIIVGAGLSGLSTAIALPEFIPASQFLEVNIYDNTNLGTGNGGCTKPATPKVSASRLGASQAFEDGEALALLLAGNLEKDQHVDEAASRSILGLLDVRAERAKGIRAEAMRWKDPKMPMSWLQTCGLYIALFLLVRVKNLTNYFRRTETWERSRCG
ncbi:hypothetical protein F5Y06DRAFT_256071, partial [Hypoxylon sp. FL0890]